MPSSSPSTPSSSLPQVCREEDEFKGREETKTELPPRTSSGLVSSSPPLLRLSLPPLLRLSSPHSSPCLLFVSLQNNNEWAKFKNDGFPQYPQLCIVFGDTYATGEYAAGNVEDLLMSEGEDNGGGGGTGVGDSEEFNEHHINEGVSTPDMTATPVREKHKLDRTPNSKRRRKSNTYDVSGTCKAIQEMIKFRTGQSTSGSVTSHAPLPPVDPYSIRDVVVVLNDMPNLEQDLYNKAVNQACLNAIWREAFIISLPERRRGLLESL